MAGGARETGLPSVTRLPHSWEVNTPHEDKSSSCRLLFTPERRLWDPKLVLATIVARGWVKGAKIDDECKVRRATWNDVVSRSRREIAASTFLDIAFLSCPYNRKVDRAKLIRHSESRQSVLPGASRQISLPMPDNIELKPMGRSAPTPPPRHPETSSLHAAYKAAEEKARAAVHLQEGNLDAVSVWGIAVAAWYVHSISLAFLNEQL